MQGANATFEINLYLFVGPRLLKKNTLSAAPIMLLIILLFSNKYVR